MTRRQLLRTGVILSGTVTAASMFDIPGVLEKVVYAAAMENVRNDETIGMIQLGGGLDGLNTVIPLTDGLERARPGFGDRVIQDALNAGTRLSNDFALHPSLKYLARRFREGHVAIVMDLSYPGASKSHFQATQIWQTADPTMRQLSGSFGRLAPYIDSQGHPLGLTGLGGNTVPGILRGQGQVAVMPTNLATYGFKQGVDQALATLWKAGVPGVYGQMLTDLMNVARNTTAQIRSVSAMYRSQGDYAGVNNNTVIPTKNNLASNLQTAAALIKGGAAPTVFTTVIGGWDTHENEQTRQSSLLTLVDQAVDAFLNDCAAVGKFPTIAFYTEFGRTIKVNSSGGCDHGRATPILIVGDRVLGGVYGTKPDLSGYDVPQQFDFRSMYASLIQHLGVDPNVVVGNFPVIPFMDNGGRPLAARLPTQQPAATTPRPATPRPPASPTASPRPSAAPSTSPTPAASPRP